MILNRNSTLNVDSNDDQEIPHGCYKKTTKNCLTTNTIKNSDTSRELFDTLCTLASKTRTFNFDLELISYKNDKSHFLTGLSKLQTFLKSGKCKITDGGEVPDPGFSEALCHYLLELICQAEFNSASKNYSNKIIATIKDIPDSAEYVYNFLINLTATIDLSTDKIQRDIETRLYKIYSILVLNLIQTLDRDQIGKLFDGIIILYLRISNYSCSNVKTEDAGPDVSILGQSGVEPGGALHGLKCINLLLYSKLITNYSVNNELVKELIPNLEFKLLSDSKNYQLVSSSAVCYIALILTLIHKGEEERILRVVTSGNGPEDKQIVEHVETIGRLVKKLPSFNYIYTVRSVILYLYHTQNLEGKNVFRDSGKRKILINCYEIIRDFTRKNNHFLINYSILQTIQSYTLFLGNNNKEGNRNYLADTSLTDDVIHNSKEPVLGVGEDMREYLESLLDLSNCLVDYFNNKIKTINHLAMYIYKKLMSSLFPRYAKYYNQPPRSDESRDGSNLKLEGDGLVEKLMESMKRSASSKTKYVILETVVNMERLEKVIEMEPHLVLHLVLNITNNKCIITSLLSQVLSQIKGIFRNLYKNTKEVREPVENKEYLKNKIKSISGLGEGECGEGLVEISFKCYVYPILIAIMKGYEIRHEDGNACLTLYPVSLEKGENEKEESEEAKIERWKCLNKIMMKVVPNYMFELFKMASDDYTFEHIGYLPEDYKLILKEKVIQTNKLPSKMRNFYKDVFDNMCKVEGNNCNNNHLNDINNVLYNETQELEFDNVNKNKNNKGEWENEAKAVKEEAERLNHNLGEIGGKSGVGLTLEFTDNEEFARWIHRAKIVEIRGRISYLQSVCMCNFRKINKLYFVNLERRGKRYDGIFISNHQESGSKEVKEDRDLGEIYYLEIDTYMWNLYRTENVEIALNLLNCVTNTKKIRKVVTLNEFRLVKFSLKNVIQSVNLSNQNYFIQLIQQFFERIRNNFKMLDNNTNPNDQCDENEVRGSENVKQYLVENVNEVLKILHTNLQTYNNESRIITSVSILGGLLNLFIEKGESTKDLWKRLGVCHEGIYSSLKRLFTHLKPCYHGLVHGVMDCFYSAKVGKVVPEECWDLARVLFQINQNKYEMASNMMLGVVSRFEQKELGLLLKCVQETYFKKVKGGKEGIKSDLDRQLSVNEIEDHCGYSCGDRQRFQVERQEVNWESQIRMFVKAVQGVLEHFLDNIDQLLEDNVTVAGLVHLLSNVLKTDLTKAKLVNTKMTKGNLVENELNGLYTLLVETLRHLIKNYLSPNKIEGREEINEDKGVLDCRGYRITREFEEDIKFEKSNVTINHERCDCSENLVSEKKGSWGTETDRGCRINRRFHMDNKNEFKVSNYVVYKLAKELTGALETILVIFTSRNDLLMEGGDGRLGKVEEIRRKLEELINLLIFCIINCRHVGCNDLFNNLLLLSMEKLGSIEKSTKFLKRYVCWIIHMILWDEREQEEEDPELIDSNRNGPAEDLRKLKVIDINTRSEHLSMIFISIIKAEGNKKLSSLNNKIIKTLIHIILKLEGEMELYGKKVEGFKAGVDDSENENKTKEKEKEEDDEYDEVILMIDKWYDLKRGINQCNGSCVVRGNSLESPVDLEKGNKVINVLNILRYIYRCIDLKYMNTEQLWEVIMLSLKQLETARWPLKNASSLLLSTVLEGIASNPYVLNSCTFSIGDLLEKVNELTELQDKEEALYYTLYVLKIVMEASEVINSDNLNFAHAELKFVKRLLGSRSLHLRTMSASVMCLLLNHCTSSRDELRVLESEVCSIKGDNNKLNGCLILLKMMLESSGRKNGWIRQYAVDTERRDEFVSKLSEIGKTGMVLENCILISEIVNIIDHSNSSNSNITNDTNNHFSNNNCNNIFSNNNANKSSLDKCLRNSNFYRYHRCKLMEVQGSPGTDWLKQALCENDSNLYLVTKCLGAVVGRGEFTWDLLESVYEYAVKNPRFLELFNYFFVIHNGLVEELMKTEGEYTGNSEAILDNWERCYGRKYQNVVKFCVNNLLISRKDIYVNVFKSLYRHFLLVLWSVDTLKVGSSVDKKGTIKLLRYFRCMLIKNNKSEMELPERLEISKLYKQTFCLVNNKNMNNINSNGFCGDFEIPKILKNCLALVFVNVINLLHDDSPQVRRNIRDLVTGFQISEKTYGCGKLDKNNGGFSGSTFECSVYAGFETDLLNYMNSVVEFEVLLEVFLFILTETSGTVTHITESEHNREDLYEKEENNMFREEVLIAKHVYTLIIDHVVRRVRIAEIYSFVNRAIEIIREKNEELFKNINVGLNMDLDKHQVKDVISFFTLSSIKMHILINEDHSSPDPNGIDTFAFSHSAVSESSQKPEIEEIQKNGKTKEIQGETFKEPEQTLYFWGYFEIFRTFQRFLDLYRCCGDSRCNHTSDANDLFLELRDTLTAL